MKVDLDPVLRSTPKRKVVPPPIYNARTKPIRVTLGGQDVEIREQDGVLQIRSIEGSLLVRPHTSNVILLSVEEWS